MVSSPTPSPVAPAVGPAGEPSSTPEAAKPVATYLVRVAGPNLTGKVPSLDGSRAIAAQAGAVTIAGDYVPGQWYDHHGLKGFVCNYGHYIALCGLDQSASSDSIRYTNSYEDPCNGTDTSLGRWWWPTSQVAYCTAVYDGGWIIW